MKVVLAFDSFKGCISAARACRAAAEAVKEAFPDSETVMLPLSDGGEGMVECIEAALSARQGGSCGTLSARQEDTRSPLPLRRVPVRVHDPLMNEMTAEYAISEDGRTAYMEMAAAAGLALVREEKRNPMLTSTCGVGEMIVDAARRGCSEIVIGLGGSATCDAGKGMLDAMAAAGRIPRITAVCDVSSPLFGPEGAARVFAPQKGATPEQVDLLDGRLRQFAAEAEASGAAVPEDAFLPGAGAAGGLGYALKVFLNAELSPGIETILNLTDFDDVIAGADIVITGEGRSDAQTLMGKVPCGVLRHAHAQGIPVWLLSGAVDDPDGRLAAAFDIVSCINQNDSRPASELLKPSVATDNLKAAVCRAILAER